MWEVGVLVFFCQPTVFWLIIYKKLKFYYILLGIAYTTCRSFPFGWLFIRTGTTIISSHGPESALLQMEENRHGTYWPRFARMPRLVSHLLPPVHTFGVTQSRGWWEQKIRYAQYLCIIVKILWTVSHRAATQFVQFPQMTGSLRLSRKPLSCIKYTYLWDFFTHEFLASWS